MRVRKLFFFLLCSYFLSISQKSSAQEYHWRVQVAFHSQKLSPETVSEILGKKIEYTEIPFTIESVRGFSYAVGKFPTREQAERFKVTDVFSDVENPFVILTETRGNQVRRLTASETASYLQQGSLGVTRNIKPAAIGGSFYTNTNGKFLAEEEGIIWNYVQIGASRNKMSETQVAERFSSPQNVIEKKHRGWYIYLIDERFRKYKPAEKMSKTTKTEDAFVVFVLNGYRIDVPFAVGDNAKLAIQNVTKSVLLSDARKRVNTPLPPLGTGNSGASNESNNQKNNSLNDNQSFQNSDNYEETTNTEPSSFGNSFAEENLDGFSSNSDETGNNNLTKRKTREYTDAEKYPFKEASFKETDFFIQFGNYSTPKTLDELKDLLNENADKYDIFEFKREDNYNYLIGGPFPYNEAKRIKELLFSERIVSFVPRARSYEKDKIRRIYFEPLPSLEKEEETFNFTEEPTEKILPIEEETPEFSTQSNTPVETTENDGKKTFYVRVFSTLSEKDTPFLETKFKKLYQDYGVFIRQEGEQYEYFVGGPFSAEDAETMRIIVVKLNVHVRARVINGDEYENIVPVNDVQYSIPPAQYLQQIEGGQRNSRELTFYQKTPFKMATFKKVFDLEKRYKELFIGSSEYIYASKNKDGSWKKYTYEEYLKTTNNLTYGLLADGIKKRRECNAHLF